MSILWCHWHSFCTGSGRLQTSALTMLLHHQKVSFRKHQASWFLHIQVLCHASWIPVGSKFQILYRDSFMHWYLGTNGYVILNHIEKETGSLRILCSLGSPALPPDPLSCWGQGSHVVCPRSLAPCYSGTHHFSGRMWVYMLPLVTESRCTVLPAKY